MLKVDISVPKLLLTTVGLFAIVVLVVFVTLMVVAVSFPLPAAFLIVLIVWFLGFVC